MDLSQIIAIVEFLLLVLAGSYIVRINSQQKKEGELDAINSRFDEIIEQLRKSEELKKNIWKTKKQWEFKQQIYIDLIKNLSEMSTSYIDLCSYSFNPDGTPIPDKDQEKTTISNCEDNLTRHLKEFTSLSHYSNLVVNKETQKGIRNLVSKMTEFGSGRSRKILKEKAFISGKLAYDISMVAEKDLLSEES